MGARKKSHSLSELPQLHSSQNGLAAVSGVLTFNTVSALREEGDKLIINRPTMNFNFSKVTRCDSSALSLLVAWARFAKQTHCEIKFTELPRQLLEMAKLSKMDLLFTISEDE